MIRDIQGNLLEAKADALVNPVNCVGTMGAGLALQFKRAWPVESEDYMRSCRKKKTQIGKVHASHTGLAEPRFIIHFPTKLHWKNPSKLEYIQSGLMALCECVKCEFINSIAIPRLGCGYGGLDWGEVRPLIVYTFESMPKVDVQLFSPKD